MFIIQIYKFWIRIYSEVNLVRFESDGYTVKSVVSGPSKTGPMETDVLNPGARVLSWYYFWAHL